MNKTFKPDFSECPWSDKAEYKLVSVDGCATSAIIVDDVAQVLGHDGGSDFQRSEIAVVKLKDGRFVGWESWAEDSESGFYGGDVEVWFAYSLAALKPMFSEQAWEVLHFGEVETECSACGGDGFVAWLAARRAWSSHARLLDLPLLPRVRKMKVYKLIVMIIDHDNVGDSISQVLRDASYPNDCISPHVISMEHVEVDWSDDHPLNQGDTWRMAFAELFDEGTQ